MIGKVESGGSQNNISQTSAAGGQRVAYNPKTQKFGPVTKSGNITHMNQVGKQVSQVRVPTDLSSPAVLTKVKTKNESKAAQIRANTQGVNVKFTQKLIDSVRIAQQSL
ncbi:hypothetical protein ACFLR2_00170 [Chlamydiota bacterium]